MQGLIGKREHLKQFRLSSYERREVIALSDAGLLAPLYQRIIDRMNEYELSLHQGGFYSETLGEEMALNYVACLLKNDVLESIHFEVSGALVSKLCKIFLQSLIDVCEQEGVIELDAQDILKRSAAIANGLGITENSEHNS